MVIARYIIRQTAGAFGLVLVVLTVMIWMTQALRDLDTVTSSGQALLVFLAITALALPSLVAIIAPIALFLAIVWTLNRLNGDSELVVMNAAGLATAGLARPFLLLAALVTIGVGTITLVLQPMALREMRVMITKARADLLSRVIREGQFTPIEQGLTFHVRERTGSGVLLGIFVEDARSQDQTLVYIAERGEIVESPEGTFLLLDKGSVQRELAGEPAPAVVTFERYAFDLSEFAAIAENTNFKPRERYTSELIAPDPGDRAYQSAPGRFRAELIDRVTAPLYPVAFMSIALAALGRARTTRGSRTSTAVTAIATVVLLRIAGFGAQIASARSPVFALFAIALPLVATALAWLAILDRVPARLTAMLARPWQGIATRLEARTGARP